MQEVAYLAAESVHQRGGGVERKADQVNHDVGTQFHDPVTKDAVPVLLLPVRCDLADLLPLGCIGVGPAGFRG
ncbi:hypothetical protein StoSoilB13_27750 (plasmid) [Arthrobacter sp. StoSoilB13]|nr:hypothetical protein StoSoilB13_27750 [Arthrobacter sp. StoSoilB13]